MDFVKSAMNSAKGSENKAPQQSGTQQSGAQQDDYVDKAFAMGSKQSGHNIDRNTQEKITDGGRNLYEKVTGNKVDPKVSN